jgi:D-alanyl-D-alanine carboxypeptidase/D-alanyl-D-alanine-endopeptidase (penicillin-binding protein 4)
MLKYDRFEKRIGIMKNFLPNLLLIIFLTQEACTSSRTIVATADGSLAQQPDLRLAHVGICVFDPANSAYLFRYQADKYFVPASNTKLFSLYAGMKWLGDSIPGIGYVENDTAILLLPSGDPTFLHPDFATQPVVSFLKSNKKNLYLTDGGWKEQALGPGWSWDDYNDDYMVERSPLPVYGNVIRWVEEKQRDEKQSGDFDSTTTVYSIPDINWKVEFSKDTSSKRFFVKRHQAENNFELTLGKERYKFQDVPFVTGGIASAIELLKDTIGRQIIEIKGALNDYSRVRTIYSRPVDSLFRPMIYRSDNFFAEQTLLMVGARKIWKMDDQKIIDTLLNSDLKDLPQRPKWVDGSGLSRYNLITPEDFVWLLNRMKDEFGIERMKSLLPTGGTGTLGNYYKQDSGYIFAKTGSLSGVICLSGYLITRKSHLLIFSVLVNNLLGNGGSVRREVEGFLNGIIEKY